MSGWLVRSGAPKIAAHRALGVDGVLVSPAVHQIADDFDGVLRSPAVHQMAAQRGLAAAASVTAVRRLAALGR